MPISIGMGMALWVSLTALYFLACDDLAFAGIVAGTVIYFALRT